MQASYSKRDHTHQPGCLPVEVLYVVIEEAQRQQEGGEPRQPIAGDGQSAQQAIELRQEDIHDERKTVINGVLGLHTNHI